MVLFSGGVLPAVPVALFSGGVLLTVPVVLFFGGVLPTKVPSDLFILHYSQARCSGDNIFILFFSKFLKLCILTNLPNSYLFY